MMDKTAATEAKIDRSKLQSCLVRQRELFAREHLRSAELFEQARSSMLSGVPMNWMVKWAGDFPLFVREAGGAHFIDVDGHEYIDLCLGDTGAMTGHAPPAAVEAIVERVRHGTTFMLPTEDSIWVAQELSRRFGLPFWQVALTATDANRFAIRLARQITGRKLILIFNWCYHGTVDETFITLEGGIAGVRRGNLGPAVDPTETTRVVEFNDISALEAALKDGAVACVLAEPAMTNIGIVQPEPGFHQALRDITRRTGTLLILDETHTICAGPGGCTQAWGLQPDMLTLGKPIASGIPAAVYGFSRDVAGRIAQAMSVGDSDTSGIGGTLAGNALSIAAMKATLEHVLTEPAYERMIALASRFTEGVQSVIQEKHLPWIVKQLGCRAEYWFSSEPPLNGGQAAAAVDSDLDCYMHLSALNAGILITPFHNMALISPATSEADIDRHSQVFRESVEAILG